MSNALPPGYWPVKFTFKMKDGLIVLDDKPKEFHHEFVHDKIEAYSNAIRAEGFDVPSSGLALADRHVDKALQLVQDAREELRLAMRALREHKP